MCLHVYVNGLLETDVDKHRYINMNCETCMDIYIYIYIHI